MRRKRKEEPRASSQRPILWWLRKRLPETPGGDRVWHWVTFHRRHGRLPRKRGGDLNDFLLFLLSGPEITREPRRSVTCKLGLRDHVRRVLAADRCVPLLAVLESAEQARDYEFPLRCVVKPSHLSGQVVLRGDGERVDVQRVTAWLATDYYKRTRERNYRGLEPRILVEPYLTLPGGREFKIHCLRGEPRAVSVFQDLQGDSRRYRFTTEWKEIDPPSPGAPADDDCVPRPENLDEMLGIARRLAQDFFYARIDLLPTAERVYVGEITSAPGGANIKEGDPVGWRRFNRLFFGDGGFDLEDFPALRASNR